MTEQPATQPQEVDTSGVTVAFDKRKTIIGAIVTLVTLVIVFFGIIPKFGSYADAWAEIQKMTFASLMALILSIVIMIALYVLPYQAAVPGLAYRPAFVIRQTSFMISNAIPAGGAVGVAIQYPMLSSYGVSPAAATAGIAVTSLWSVLMTLTLPVMGVLAALTTGEMQDRWIIVAVVGLAATVAAIVALWLILRSEASAQKVGELGNRLIAPVNRRRQQPLDVVAGALDLRHSTASVLTTRWHWVTLSNYLVVFSQFSILWFSIKGIGGPGTSGLSLAGAFAAFSISRMASMIPITPGGLGTVDAALIALLVTFGMAETEAVAATLVWRAGSFIPQVVLGVITFLWWRVRQARAGLVVQPAAQPAAQERQEPPTQPAG